MGITFNKLIKMAYRKVKSYAYFDKTQSFLKKRILDFEDKESDYGSLMDNLEKDIQDILDCFSLYFEADLNHFNTDQEMYKKCLQEVSVKVIPKKLENRENSNSPLYTNINSSDRIMIKSYQYLIDLPIELHVISMLWTMLIGSNIDKTFDQSIFGNRIKESFQNKAHIYSNSPYLMRPYFEQYESWRDTAIKHIEEIKSENNNALMINLDLKRFYYNVELTKEHFDDIEANYYDQDPSQLLVFNVKEYSHKINIVIFSIMYKYTEEIKKIYTDEEITSNCILPIGFIPSAILSNYYLTKFDIEIKNTKPVYYGRYVDDIIIVYKIFKETKLYDELKEIWKTEGSSKDRNKGKLADPVVKWKELLNNIYCNHEHSDSRPWGCLKKTPEEQSKLVFSMQGIDNKKTTIKFNDEKMNLYYFDAHYSLSMLEEFKRNIWKNKSEFRFLPDDVLRIDYSKFAEKETNKSFSGKISDVPKFKVDRFELSKLIGKNLQNLRNISVQENREFISDMTELLDEYTLLDSVLNWEHIFTLYIFSRNVEKLKLILQRIVNVIEKLKTGQACGDTKLLTNSLKIHFMYSFARAFSLNIGKFESDFFHPELDKADFGEIIRLSNQFVSSNMTNKYYFGTIPSILENDAEEIVHNSIQIVDYKYIFSNINFENELMLAIKDNEEYKDSFMLPYNIAIYDIQVLKLSIRINENRWSMEDDGVDDSEKYSEDNTTKIVNDVWAKINGFRLSNGNIQLQDSIIIKDYRIGNIASKATTVKRIIDYKDVTDKNEITVAIGNTKLAQQESYFDSIRNDKPNRTNYRSKSLVEVINSTIFYKGMNKESVDLLVLPECYVPIDWLPILINTAKKNKLAIISGLEHIKIENSGKTQYYNFLVSIFPVEVDGFTLVNVNFHLKVHYSPIEMLNFTNLVEGNMYEMHIWRGLKIAPYCCYELTSIQDRIIFKNDGLNTVAAIVWNSDIDYFSNIVESLSRDLSCYVLQANHSNYGDSRIYRPARKEYRDVLRFSGGINHNTLIAYIEIGELLDFLKKPILVQKQDKKWKTKCP